MLFWKVVEFFGSVYEPNFILFCFSKSFDEEQESATKKQPRKSLRAHKRADTASSETQAKEKRYESMWLNQANLSVNSSTSYFIFLLDVNFHWKSCIMQKTPLNWACHFKIMTYGKVVKTINKRDYFLCLVLSPNQFLQIPTHFCLIIPHMND